MQRGSNMSSSRCTLPLGQAGVGTPAASKALIWQLCRAPWLVGTQGKDGRLLDLWTLAGTCSA